MPIQNRQSEAPVARFFLSAIRRCFRLEKPQFRNPKVRFQPTISTFPRFSCSNVSLDDMNDWWGHNTESAYDDDRKLCSTRCKNSSPVKEPGINFRPGVGVTYVTTIRNQHSQTVDKTSFLRNSVVRPKFHPRACVLVHRARTPSVGFEDFRSGAQFHLRERGRNLTMR
ncbi:hypothetical protein Taro_046078 [Colocasia esculenta]|uniref:Uncharacterized protein n=1 Tax=Colocasia esculenta TaxID=4460 RepID=A0A843WNU3_COLES|nr:hypothetical protein [Colocasia esculenta]